MNVLDVVIILAALAYGIGGFRNGAVVGAFSMVGFFGGAILGAQLAGPLGERLVEGTARVPVAIVCVLMFSMFGQLLGVYAAGFVKRHVVTERSQSLDAGVGSALGIASVLLVAWMVAVPLASSPYPSLSSAASHSSIVRAVNDVMPENVRTLYGSLRSFLNQSGFPPVFGDLPATPDVSVPAPDPKLSPAVAARVRKARQSIFKIYGEAPSCGRGIEGSGFVYAPKRILTNAHVVAGTSQVGVQVSTGRLLPATVVVYDPRRDVAVLAVPDLDAPVLRFATEVAGRGDPAIVAGYPEDGPFTPRTARVRTRITVSGNDIYGQSSVRRDVYAIRAIVRSGNSGGPLLSPGGTVLGMVFATALDSSDTGYVLTDAEIARDAQRGRTAVVPVATGRCTPG